MPRSISSTPQGAKNAGLRAPSSTARSSAVPQDEVQASRPTSLIQPLHAWQSCRTGSALALLQPTKTALWLADPAIHSVIDSHQLGGAGDRRCNSHAHQTMQSL